MKDKASLWQRHIRNQQKSTLTIQDYCNQHRLNSGTFYYWKGKLRQQKETLTFKEVHIMEPPSMPEAIRVRFPSGIELWLDKETEAAFLRSL